MTRFAEIRARAVERLGGEDALAARLPSPKDETALKSVADDRYLSLMSFRIFCAGLKHSMVEAKWPVFEEVFHGFSPARVRAMHDEELEALMGESRIIRHWGKIRAVHANATAICAIAEEADGFGAWLAGWQPEQTVQLWQELAKRFSQLGGNSGPYFLRMAGKDTFVPTPAVLKALQHWRLYDGTGKGKREQRKLQDVFDALAAECGLPFCQISMTLAASVD